MGHKLQKEQVKVCGNVWRENMDGEKSYNYAILLKIKVKRWVVFYNQ